jgi:hypothetical protein
MLVFITSHIGWVVFTTLELFFGAGAVLSVASVVCLPCVIPSSLGMCVSMVAGGCSSVVGLVCGTVECIPVCIPGTALGGLGLCCFGGVGLCGLGIFTLLTALCGLGCLGIPALLTALCGLTTVGGLCSVGIPVLMTLFEDLESAITGGGVSDALQGLFGAESATTGGGVSDALQGLFGATGDWAMGDW